MYKMVEVVGTSAKGFTEAVESAVKGLADSGEKIYWIEVVEQRGAVKESKVWEYQVKINAGVKSGK